MPHSVLDALHVAFASTLSVDSSMQKTGRYGTTARCATCTSSSLNERWNLSSRRTPSAGTTPPFCKWGRLEDILTVLVPSFASRLGCLTSAVRGMTQRVHTISLFLRPIYVETCLCVLPPVLFVDEPCYLLVVVPLALLISSRSNSISILCTHCIDNRRFIAYKASRMKRWQFSR